jgi:hypothetical protein
MAIKCKQKILSLIFTALLISSLLSHGEYIVPHSYYFDKVLAHLITLSLTYYGFIMILKGKDNYLFPFLIGVLVMISYKSKITKNKKIHAFFLHFLGAIGLTFFILALIK